jgi:ATP-dependent DNA helicase RecG
MNIIDILLSPITSIKSIGPIIASRINHLVNGDKIFDLLLHLPISVEKIKVFPRLFDLKNNQPVFIKVKIEQHLPNSKPNQPYKILCYTPTGYVSLVFFKIFPSQINLLKIGSEMVIFGNFKNNSGENQIVHPRKIVELSKFNKDNAYIENNVIYPLTAGLNNIFLQEKIQQILAKISKISKINNYQNLVINKQLESFSDNYNNNVNFNNDIIADFDDWLPVDIKNKLALPNLAQSLIAIHNPKNDSQILDQDNISSGDSEKIYQNNNQNFSDENYQIQQARRRLALDELLAWQISFMVAKNSLTKLPKIQDKFLVNSKKFYPILHNIFLQSLPFNLTNNQEKICNDLACELFSNYKMLHLLQGDVGSGKTIIAIYLSFLAAISNKQIAVIVPTAILANQHFQYFSKIFNKINQRIEDFNKQEIDLKRSLMLKFGINQADIDIINQNNQFLYLPLININLLTSAVKSRKKSDILNDLAFHKTQIMIATHAVLEDNVVFANLGLAIIDEQHRFGVLQRMKLINKGKDVDCLLMSATPIPRSLMMSLYSDMSISLLKEKPKNRQTIQTAIIRKNKIDNLYQSILKAVNNNEKIYWICPAIEQNGDNQQENINCDDENAINDYQIANILQSYNNLLNYFDKDQLGLVHGKMKEVEKNQIMQEFSDINSKIKILIATTVIEVGIDISDATIIIIEDAERFGLAQLHQLRGRVGRGDKASFCILLCSNKVSNKARERLQILKESNDGFLIAEADLKIRGSGELAGTKQSGFPDFKIANLNNDYDLLNIANKIAKEIIANDKFLTQDRNVKYQNLLKLFNYQQFLQITA